MSLACPFDFSISVCVLIAVQTHRLSYLCSTDMDTDTKFFLKWEYGHGGGHATSIFICLYNIVVFKIFSKFKLQNVYKTECDMPI